MTTRHPNSALQSLLRLLWRQPLLAVPFAIFFGTIWGSNARSILVAYKMSLVFSFTIGLFIWATEYLVLPRLRSDGDRTRQALTQAASYVGASISGSCVAAWIVNRWVMPGFIGSVRSLAVFAMFTLLFCALFMAISYAMSFFRETVERAKSEQELTLARRIQRSFLLSSFPAMPRLEVHAINVSSKQVGGDFYDVVPAGEDAFLLAIADVAGKGVPAALLSSMLQASLRTQAAGTPSVGQILRNINHLVYRSTTPEQFATFFLARVEESTLRFSYSNAGHNYPLVFRAGTRTPLVHGGTVVGFLADAEFAEDAMTLAPGDRVVFYTDGISEASRDGMDMYGEDRLAALVAGLDPLLSARDVTERILASVREYLGDREAGDDMTVMVLRVLEHDALVTAAPAPLTR
jgi:Stage II sporulation protein E (SpoIIE)